MFKRTRPSVAEEIEKYKEASNIICSILKTWTQKECLDKPGPPKGWKRRSEKLLKQLNRMPEGTEKTQIEALLMASSKGSSVWESMTTLKDPCERGMMLLSTGVVTSEVTILKEMKKERTSNLLATSIQSTMNGEDQRELFKSRSTVGGAIWTSVIDYVPYKTDPFEDNAVVSYLITKIGNKLDPLKAIKSPSPLRDCIRQIVDNTELCLEKKIENLLVVYCVGGSAARAGALDGINSLYSIAPPLYTE